MKIEICPRCHKKGSLTFRPTKKPNHKYPYVKHYDPKKKSKISSCYLHEGELWTVKFTGSWYNQYLRLIRKISKQYRTQFNSYDQRLQYIFLISSVEMMQDKFSKNKTWGKTWLIASKLLKKNGYYVDLVHDRVRHDLSTVVIDEAIGLKKEPVSKKSLLKVLQTRENWIKLCLQAQDILHKMANSKDDDYPKGKLAKILYEIGKLNLKNKP